MTLQGGQPEGESTGKHRAEIIMTENDRPLAHIGHIVFLRKFRGELPAVHRLGILHAM